MVFGGGDFVVSREGGDLLFPGKEGIYCFQGRRGSVVSRERGDLLFPGKEGIYCFQGRRGSVVSREGGDLLFPGIVTDSARNSV